MTERELTEADKDSLKRQIVEEIVMPAVERELTLIDDASRNVGQFRGTKGRPYDIFNSESYFRTYR